MALSAGTRIGPYEISSPIGAGGMGEVYRARDTRLDRQVAVKILPARFSDDPDRLARFEREARALASLNHPHIAQIYGVEEADGIRAFAMELVEGETLADRLGRGPIAVKEALEIARQIAGALDAAHERGIIHRDLKPANIKVRPDGTVKVLDFGLAKAFGSMSDSDPAQSPTVTEFSSHVGVILGTAAYMSPEQARGLAVDKRTDIWAFGAVLYELLTGGRAFPGPTVSDTIAAIISREPDWAALPGSAPPSVRRLLLRCLAKDPQRRVRDIGDVSLEIDETLASGVASGAPIDRTPRPPAARWALAAAGVIAAIGIVVLVWALQGGRRNIVRPVTRATVTLSGDQKLDTTNMAEPLALSPDGRRLVYVANSTGQTQLYLRNLDAFAARPIGGTDGARYPFFSPDGEWVAFFSQGKLKRVSLQGGAPVTICEVPIVGRGGAWARDGTIVFDPGESGLMRVSATGGPPESLKSRDAVMDRTNLSWPHFLPDSRVVLATAGIGSNSRIVALSLDSGEWRDIGQGFQPHYVPPGYLIFHAAGVREGEIHVVPFDATTLTAGLGSVSVLGGVFRSENGGGAYFAVSRTGSLIFAPGGHARTLVRVERSGRRTPLTDDRRGFRFPAISPDGRGIAVTVDPRPSQIWVYDLVRKSGIPLATTDHNLWGRWTPDGRQVVYTSGGEMYVRAADASTGARRLLARTGAQYAGAWLQDARSLIFADDAGPPNRSDIWLLPAGSEPRALIATAAHEVSPALSPDRQWLAYTSDETGRQEVHVRPFPGLDRGKWVVSTGGGVAPVWSPTSRELFYMSGNALMAVRVNTQAGDFSAAPPERLFDGPFETGSPQFDIAPDGSYFVMVEGDPDARPTQIQVVLNWLEELARLVPAK
jgi:Tol biopolymer transport system component